MLIRQLHNSILSLPRLGPLALTRAGIITSAANWTALKAEPIGWCLALDPDCFARLCALIGACEDFRPAT